MAAELKTEEKTVVSAQLVLSIEITDENRKPIGLAAHAVLTGFAWDPANPGHDALKRALSDIKAELGVRAPRTGKSEPEAPKPAKRERKSKSKPATDDGGKPAGVVPEKKLEEKLEAAGDTTPPAFNPFDVPASAANEANKK